VTEPAPQLELEEPVVPGTEGTEYEGMSEDAIERAEFDKVVKADPDMDDPLPAAVVPEPEPDPEPEPEPAAATVPADPPPAAAPTPEPTGFEWLDELPEETRAKATDIIERQGQALARLDQRARSHLGQLRPAQRAIENLGRELRELRATQAAEKKNLNPDIKARIRDYNAWVDKEYEDFPEEAAKLKTRFVESLDGVAIQPAEPSPQPSVMAGPDRNEESHHLQTAYSDWGERRNSPEFEEWFAHQGPETKQLLNSPYAADNVLLLDQFTGANPNWEPPQTPEEFVTVNQAQHSPLFRGWCMGENINPDAVVNGTDLQKHSLLNKFKTDLGVVRSESEPAPDPKLTRLAERRAAQLRDRNPGSRRAAITPGAKIDLNTEEGQKAYYKQLVDADPDLN